MKRILLTLLVLVCLGVAILLRITDKPAQSIEAETGSGSNLNEVSQPNPADAPTGSKIPAAGLQRSQVAMTAVQYVVDPTPLNRERENPPYELRGGAGNGRVIDRQGNVVLESSEEIGIFGAAVGPDNMKILVKGGNAINFVLIPSSGRKFKLPAIPPGVNMLGFGDWHWIGPDLLFGTSGVEKIYHDGPHENCCNENNVSQTKFYTFDLLTERLSEVAMPREVTQPVVHVVEVISDGHIHLWHQEPNKAGEQDLGWFKLESSK